MFKVSTTRAALSVALLSMAFSAVAAAQSLGNPWSQGGGQLPPAGSQPPGYGYGDPALPPTGHAPVDSWPGYDATIVNVQSIYNKLMFAKRAANNLAARGQFDTASTKLVQSLDEIKGLAQWNYNRPAPTTVAAAQAARALAATVAQATQTLPGTLGSQVRFITISDFFKVVQWAYGVDTHYYRAVANNPYGGFPKSYFNTMQELGKLVLEIQSSLGRYQASNAVEFRVTREVARSVRYILAHSVLRRSLEGVGFELLYVEQLCLEAMSSPFTDSYILHEIRSRLESAARSISSCVYDERPNYPRPQSGIDYYYPDYGYGTSDGFGGRRGGRGGRR